MESSSRSINEMEPGDYVKTEFGFEKIADIWGISKKGRLAKPSWGGFWVELEDGSKVDMWHARGYYKATDQEVINALRKSA